MIGRGAVPDVPGPRRPAMGRRTTTPGASARARPQRSAAVAPPPDLVLAAPWSATSIRPSSAEVALVQRWMASPHVARHWQQDWSKAAWDDEIAAQHAGGHSRPWLVAHDSEPLAYVETYRAAIDLVAEHVAVGAHDLGVHVAIGDEDRVGIGLGTGVLRAVALALFAVEPGCPRVLGDPDVTNEAACRAFASAGYERIEEIELPHKRAAIMACERGSLAGDGTRS